MDSIGKPPIRLDHQQRIATVEGSPSNWSPDQLKDLGQSLCELSDEYPFAFFDGGAASDQIGVVLCCGFLERFRTLTVLGKLDNPCLLIQDPVAPWYTGSDFCLDAVSLAGYIQRLFGADRRMLVLGQSSGGYAALLLSRYLPSCVALAFAPQTFDDSAYKRNNLHLPPGFRASVTLNGRAKIADLRELFFKSSRPSQNKAYILSAFSEHDNPPTEWFWIDAMHWGRLVDHPDVQVFLTTATKHPILLHHTDVFAALLRRIVMGMADAGTNVTEVIRDGLYGTVAGNDLSSSAH